MKVNFKAAAGVLAGPCLRVMVWVTCSDLSSRDIRSGALRSEEMMLAPPPLTGHSLI